MRHVDGGAACSFAALPRAHLCRRDLLNQFAIREDLKAFDAQFVAARRMVGKINDGKIEHEQSLAFVRHLKRKFHRADRISDRNGFLIFFEHTLDVFELYVKSVKGTAVDKTAKYPHRLGIN